MCARRAGRLIGAVRVRWGVRSTGKRLIQEGKRTFRAMGEMSGNRGDGHGDTGDQKKLEEATQHSQRQF